MKIYGFTQPNIKYCNNKNINFKANYKLSNEFSRVEKSIVRRFYDKQYNIIKEIEQSPFEPDSTIIRYFKQLYNPKPKIYENKLVKQIEYLSGRKFTTKYNCDGSEKEVEYFARDEDGIRHYKSTNTTTEHISISTEGNFYYECCEKDKLTVSMSISNDGKILKYYNREFDIDYNPSIGVIRNKKFQYWDKNNKIYNFDSMQKISTQDFHILIKDRNDKLLYSYDTINQDIYDSNNQKIPFYKFRERSLVKKQIEQYFENLDQVKSMKDFAECEIQKILKNNNLASVNKSNN